MINTAAYDVHLDTFEGPLDLLLHLVRKSDLEIKEIQVSEITAEYLSYLEVMTNLNLDVAGDFIVMASTLMQIKAKLLHPDNQEDAADADIELDKIKAKLLEYQKYKEVSKILANKELRYSQTYYRPQPVIESDDFVLSATIYDLIASFQEALKTLPEEVREIMYKEIPIETKIREILDVLEGRQYVSFTEILKLQPTRQSMIVSFMAVLELMKNKQILAKQSDLFDEIRIYRVYFSEEENEIKEDTLGLEVGQPVQTEQAEDLKLIPEEKFTQEENDGNQGN